MATFAIPSKEQSKQMKDNSEGDPISHFDFYTQILER
jgi:hypothetical protein